MTKRTHEKPKAVAHRNGRVVLNINLGDLLGILKDAAKIDADSRLGTYTKDIVGIVESLNKNSETESVEDYADQMQDILDAYKEKT